ncbi:MAG: acetate kinase [Nanoarchaeota archaeon]|nr:acetate kinase [Nanoarchaeota archaeon]MBU1029704.1 acetate kinase [Nanoarchaeota archaeon]MBU1850109.1 acetate kinase [Nanoarchaeota archaeon]
MIILVLNAGSSSLKYQVINSKSEKILIKGHVDAIGLSNCSHKYSYKEVENNTFSKIKNHEEAAKQALKTIESTVGLNKLQAVGHRVVHGGELYQRPVKINDLMLQKITEFSKLAPLHNPPNIAGINACKKHLPNLKQVAIFDTSFHCTMPKKAYLYAIPLEYYQKCGVRKYGFHGTSHEYVSLKAAKILKKRNPNLVTCHLGNGSSITSVKKGVSVDTSMGFTPLQGVIMGTRSGTIDPSIVEFLSKSLKKDVSEVMNILYKESGLKGICGESDMRIISKKALKGNKKCILACEMLAYSGAKYIAAHMVALPSIDAIVFTGGMGEGSSFMREKICDNLLVFGVKIDAKKNAENKSVDISAKNSKIKLLVVHTNEELMIAKETEIVLKKLV